MGDEEATKDAPLTCKETTVVEKLSSTAPQDRTMETTTSPKKKEQTEAKVKGDDEGKSSTATNLKLVCRSDFWGRSLAGKWYRDPQNPTCPYRLIMTQAVLEQKGRFWGCCPQQGARVLEITENHFIDQNAGEKWDLYHLNSVPAPENLIFHNLILIPQSQTIIDIDRKMYEEEWKYLGTISASMARSDLEPLVKPFLEPNENLEFHANHVHLILMMDKATDRPEVRKQKNQKMQQKKQGGRGSGSASPNTTGGGSTSPTNDHQARIKRNSNPPRAAPSPLTTVGSHDSSEAPSVITQASASAFASFNSSVMGYGPYYGSGHSHQQQHYQHQSSSGAASRNPMTFPLPTTDHLSSYYPYEFQQHPFQQGIFAPHQHHNQFQQVQGYGFAPQHAGLPHQHHLHHSSYHYHSSSHATPANIPSHWHPSLPMDPASAISYNQRHHQHNDMMVLTQPPAAGAASPLGPEHTWYPPHHHQHDLRHQSPTTITTTGVSSPPASTGSALPAEESLQAPPLASEEREEQSSGYEEAATGTEE